MAAASGKEANFPYPALVDPFENDPVDEAPETRAGGDRPTSTTSPILFSQSVASDLSGFDGSSGTVSSRTQKRYRLLNYEDDSIRVAIRVRPPNALEQQRKEATVIFTASDGITIQVLLALPTIDLHLLHCVCVCVLHNVVEDSATGQQAETNHELPSGIWRNLRPEGGF